MRIGIIGGTGREGRGLAVRWARAGHDVSVGSRDAGRAQAVAVELSAAAGRPIAGTGNEAAVASAEVALLAVPYAVHAATLRALRGALAGRILVDITVPLVPPGVTQVQLPAGGAAALEAAALLDPTTRVVAGLHHVGSAHLADPDAPIDCDALVCGDDDGARRTVLALAADLGLRAIDAGPLRNAIALEALTPVLLHINRTRKASCGVRITGLH